MKPFRLLSLALLPAFAACGAIPTKQFTFRAIDAGENPRPCMVVVDDDWPAAAEKEQFVHVTGDELKLTLPFRSSEIEITVAPVMVENGKVTRVPKSRKEAVDYSGFKEETRRLRITDPALQLFILARKGGSS